MKKKVFHQKVHRGNAEALNCHVRVLAERITHAPKALFPAHGAESFLKVKKS